MPPQLDGLLDEVRDLRLTLASDLSAAAGAAEAGAHEVAADIIDADRRELARFMRVADIRLARLQGLVVPQQEAPRWRRRVALSLPAIPLVGAMALSAAAATGVLPLPGTSSPGQPGRVSVVPTATATARADSAFHQFETLVDGYPSASQVLAAAAVLHRQLAVLIAASPHDPAQVQEVAQLLRMEQSLLLRRQPPGTPIVLAAAHQLAARLADAVAPDSHPTPRPGLPGYPSQKHAAKPEHSSPSPSTSTSTSKSSAPQPAPTPPPTSAPTSSPSAQPAPTSASTPGVSQIANLPN